MTQQFAKAYPRKRFFLEMFTRDISLGDCVLDLIDNSVESLARTQKFSIPESVFNRTPELNEKDRKLLPKISVSFSDRSFSIEDNCGGISRKDAVEDVFNFGHGPEYADASGRRQLGTYRIGLKRAIFKIGKSLDISSRTVTEGFQSSFEVDAWASKDDTLEDWRIPIRFIGSAESAKSAGTNVAIKDLRDEVRMRLGDGEFEAQLHTQVSKTYMWFLDRYVRVEINGKPVTPYRVPFGGSDQVEAAYDAFEENGVTTKLFASLAARTERGEWQAESAGWYVMCNGRTVAVADKTDLTGWGGGSRRTFQPKYRGFVGFAFFASNDPLELPWTTTKRGLNRESAVYQKARNRMFGVARPILTFLDRMYSSEVPEEPEERAIAEKIQSVDLREIASRGTSTFQVKRPPKSSDKTTTRVQYDAERTDLEKIKKHLRKPSIGANRIGELTFEYYLKTEGLS